MPFEVAGCTTLSNSINQVSGTMLLCLSVLTADDACFSTAMSQPLSGDVANVSGLVREAYREAASRLTGEPGLILTFLPMLTTISGEQMLESINEASGGVPVFGTIACDFDSATYSNTCVIHNGSYSCGGMGMILVSGNVKPRFVLASISEKNLHRQNAIITESEGSILKKVNDMSARDYLLSLGLLDEEGIAGTSSLPFVVNYNDGSQPVARAIYGVHDDGSVSCGGLMPEGGTLAICHIDMADVLLTAKQSAGKFLEYHDINGIFIFSCLGRNMALGLNPMIEFDTVKEAMGDRLPWHMSYSGGEACPVYNAEGDSMNRFHNFTFIGCAI
jgi:hypothetical protein